MKRTLIGLGIAAIGAVALKLYRRRRKQQQLLDVLMHSIEDDQIHQLKLRIEIHESGRQVIRFSGVAGTASFVFTVDMHGEFPSNYFVRLGEEELNIRPFSITDAGFGYRRVFQRLQKLAEERKITAKVTQIS